MKSPPVRRTRRKSTGPARSFFGKSASASPVFFAPSECTLQQSCENRPLEKRTAHRAQDVDVSPENASARLAPLSGEGEPMSSSVRRFFESKLGSDLSCVRIHHGPDAAASAEALRAQAYAIGNDIVFNSDKYNPY